MKSTTMNFLAVFLTIWHFGLLSMSSNTQNQAALFINKGDQGQELVAVVRLGLDSQQVSARRIVETFRSFVPSISFFIAPFNYSGYLDLDVIIKGQKINVERVIDFLKVIYRNDSYPEYPQVVYKCVGEEIEESAKKLLQQSA